MGILDLKTNLKSLKYRSGEKPLITKDIENPPSNSGFVSEISRRLEDVSRVSQILLPTNSRFLENQAKLEQINFSQKIDAIKIAQEKTTAGAVIQQVKDTAVNLARVAGSTIAQAGVSGTGAHFVRGFEGGGRKSYANEALANGEVVLPNYQPLTFLTGKSNYGSENTDNVKETYLNTAVDLENTTTTANIVKGGAKIGIKNLVPTKQPVNVNDTRTDFIVEKGLPVVEDPLDIQIKDFRQGNPNVISFNYSDNTVNKELNYGLGRKGYWKKPVDYTQTRPESIDRVNAQDVTTEKLDGDEVSESKVKDFIKFRFEVLSPGKKPVFLYFRAFLNSFTDSYTGTWNTTKYIGRGEEIRNYDGFSRGVDLSFNIAATTREEMQPIYKKMVYLASTTAPTYDANGTFMKGTIVKLTLGSYFYDLPGTIDSVTYSWKELYPWEIGFQDTMQQLPHIMDCNIKFTPIHNFVPETGLKHYITMPTEASGYKPFF